MSAGTYLFRYVPFLHRKCKHISTRYLFIHDLLKQGKHLPSQNLPSLNIRTPQVLHEIAPCQIPIQTPGSDTAESNAARKITKKNPHATRLTNTPLNQCLLKATGATTVPPQAKGQLPIYALLFSLFQTTSLLLGFQSRRLRQTKSIWLLLIGA